MCAQTAAHSVSRHAAATRRAWMMCWVRLALYQVRSCAAPVVFTAAEIVISAAKKLVPKAEIALSALEIGVSVARR